jgi:hypothetical protein
VWCPAADPVDLSVLLSTHRVTLAPVKDHGPSAAIGPFGNVAILDAKLLLRAKQKISSDSDVGHEAAAGVVVPQQ